MAKIMIINGSPRAPKSNSKEYAYIFKEKYKDEVEYYSVLETKYDVLIDKMENVLDILFVFPLYVDSIPTSLLKFMHFLESYLLKNKPTISLLINCGFLEPFQNDVAMEMFRFFCYKNHFSFGSVLKIGGGEAILKTPFRFLVKRKIGKFAHSIRLRHYQNYHVTMPLSSKAFVSASTKYWLLYGAKYGLTKEEMATLEIEN